MKFFTQEMADASQKMVAEDPEIEEKLKGVTIRFILCVTDAPGNEDRQMGIAFEDGKITENILTVKPAPSDMRTEGVDTSKYAAKVSGPYETIAAVTQKKLPMLAALGSLRIEGDMNALITNMVGLTALLDVFGGMPGLEF
jgi:hypothetical protein